MEYFAKKYAIINQQDDNQSDAASNLSRSVRNWLRKLPYDRNNSDNPIINNATTQAISTEETVLFNVPRATAIVSQSINCSHTPEIHTLFLYYIHNSCRSCPMKHSAKF